MGSFINSEDQDEMPHNAAFHKGLHCLLSIKKGYSDKKNTIFSENYSLHLYNGLSQVHCIKPEGRIH